MKRLFILLSLVAIVSACDKAALTPSEEGQDCIVTINTVGEITSSESELTKSSGSTNDLYAVQVYKGTTTFAWGIFDDVSDIKLNLKTGSTYNLRICMVRDAKTMLGDNFSLTNNGVKSNNDFDGPFYVYASASRSDSRYYNYTNKFFYNSNGYHWYYQNATATSSYSWTSNSTYHEFTQIRYGRWLSVKYPTCTDWFYGEINNYSPNGETATLNVPLVRTGFKLKYELSGVTDGNVTVKVYNSERTFINNTTNTESYESEEQFIAFYDTYSAWQYADNYTENMTVAVTWVRGIGVTQDLGTKTIQVKRNCLNNIRITLGSDDKGAGLSLETEEESTMGNTSSVIPVE